MYQIGLCSCNFACYTICFIYVLLWFKSPSLYAGFALSIMRLFHSGKFHRSFAMSETSFTNAPHVGFIACISEYT